MVTSVELCRFKWVHLSERLAYEQAVKQQRMRTEISQVHTTHTHAQYTAVKFRLELAQKGW